MQTRPRLAKEEEPPRSDTTSQLLPAHTLTQLNLQGFMGGLPFPAAQETTEERLCRKVLAQLAGIHQASQTETRPGKRFPLVVRKDR